MVFCQTIFPLAFNFKIQKSAEKPTVASVLSPEIPLYD